MREIRYRGKRIDNGEWVAGHYLTRRSDEGLKHMISVQDMWGFHEVDPETVGQYTGKKDDEESEMYDGDKLFAAGNLDEELQYVGNVVWDEEDCRWEVVNFHGRFEWIPDGCVIRDNKWEKHPELLTP